MYYIKIIVNFKKTAPDPLNSLHLYVDIKQNGNDLNTYPANWTKNWIIAYGVFGKTSSIDSQKTYDYHTAFDIKPTKVVYNVDLDMNQKKINNIALDETQYKSAAAVKMVKDVKSLISTNFYEERFDQVFDISDVKSLRIVSKVSGVVIAGFNDMTFPSDKLLSDYQTDAGITLTGSCIITLSQTHTLNGNFTVACVKYYKNTSNFMLKINGSNPTAHFIVINNGMDIRANGRSRVAIPSAFHQRKVVFWMAKCG